MQAMKSISFTFITQQHVRFSNSLERENREQRSVKDLSKVSELQNCSVYRGRTWAQTECLFVREEERERERDVRVQQTSAGCYENSNEICVSYVGDHWLVPHTSLTHSLNRPSPLNCIPRNESSFNFLTPFLPSRAHYRSIPFEIPLNIWRAVRFKE